MLIGGVYRNRNRAQACQVRFAARQDRKAEIGRMAPAKKRAKLDAVQQVLAPLPRS